MTRWLRTWLPFLLGLAGMAHEIFLVPHDRTALLAALVAMIGLPAPRTLDEWRNGRGHT